MTSSPKHSIDHIVHQAEILNGARGSYRTKTGATSSTTANSQLKGVRLQPPLTAGAALLTAACIPHHRPTHPGAEVELDTHPPINTDG